MDASIAAPRIIGGDMQKFFVSSNLCQDGSGRLFFVPYYDYSKIFHIFMTNYCE